MVEIMILAVCVVLGVKYYNRVDSLMNRIFK